MNKRNLIVVLLGILWGLLPPLSLKFHFYIFAFISHHTPFSIMFIEWFWFFIIGIFVAIASNPKSFLPVLIITMLTPIISALLFAFIGSSFYFPIIAVLVNAGLFSLFAGIGYLAANKLLSLYYQENPKVA